MIHQDLKKSELFVLLSCAFLLIAIQINRKYVENPPIITLSEGNKNYRFPSGSDDISFRYEMKLKQEIIPYIDSLSERYNCNAIQIIGHTSGRGLSEKRFPSSSLDENLAKSLYRSKELSPGSNVDLGMMRAVAVMKVLQSSTQEGFLGNIDFWLPYSAGQLIKMDGKLIEYNSIANDRLSDHDSRRRVEIRLFRIANIERIEKRFMRR